MAILTAAVTLPLMHCTGARTNQVARGNRFAAYTPPRRVVPDPLAVPDTEPPALAAALAPRSAPLLLINQPLQPPRRANPDAARLMEELRAQEQEYWRKISTPGARQAEPLPLEDLLELTIEEDPAVPAALRKLLLATDSDLPLALNEQVLRYVNYFLGRGQKTLRASRSEERRVGKECRL